MALTARKKKEKKRISFAKNRVKRLEQMATWKKRNAAKNREYRTSWRSNHLEEARRSEQRQKATKSTDTYEVRESRLDLSLSKRKRVISRLDGGAMEGAPRLKSARVVCAKEILNGKESCGIAKLADNCSQGIRLKLATRIMKNAEETLANAETRRSLRQTF